jgi:hypothetical protein
MNTNIHQSTIVLLSLLAFVFGVSLLVTQSKDDGGKQPLRRTSEKELGPPARRLVHPDPNKATRLGKCSAVKYGNLTWPDAIVPESLPLNELMMHLDHPAYVSPPNKYGVDDVGPVIVDVGLFIHQISHVDVGFNSYFMEGFVDLVWCDSRLRFDNDFHYNKKHYYLEQDAAAELEEIWWPDISFVNEIGKRTTENQELVIEWDGTIEYREKFAVHLTTNFETRQFPFDKQVLVAEIESFAWNSTTLVFHVEEDLVGFSHNFRIPEFKMTGIDEHVEVKMEPRDRYPFSDLVTEFYIQRTPGYYVTKVIVPLSLIVAISWSVFWMNCWDLGDRMAISFTGILTAVAYQFIISDKLPSHVSDTFLDNFILLAFFNLVFTVVINITVHRGHTNGYCNEAIFIDKICRVLFPLLFIVGSLCLMGVQLLADGIPTAAVLGVTFGTLFIVVAVVGYFLMRQRKKREMRKIARFLGQKTESQRPSQKQKQTFRALSDDGSTSSVGSQNSLNQFKGIKAMIKKKDENIEDAQFKINTLEKTLKQEKMRRDKTIQKRDAMARISGVATLEQNKKAIAELDAEIKKKKEIMDTTLYRMNSLDLFVKSQESVRMGLVKQKDEMKEINVNHGVNIMIDQMSALDRAEEVQEEVTIHEESEQKDEMKEINVNHGDGIMIDQMSDLDRAEEVQEETVTFHEESEQGTLRQRNRQNDASPSADDG